MSDAPTASPTGEFKWTRSPEYKIVFANFYKTRTGSGDFTLTFSSLQDAPGIAAIQEVKEEIAIAMSWPILKMIARSLTTAVSAIEHAVGPIPVPAGFVPDWEQALSVVRGLGLTVQSSSGGGIGSDHDNPDATPRRV